MGATEAALGLLGWMKQAACVLWLSLFVFSFQTNYLMEEVACLAVRTTVFIGEVRPRWKVWQYLKGLDVLCLVQFTEMQRMYCMVWTSPSSSSEL